MPPFVPAEHIIATSIVIFTWFTLPLITPLAYRLPSSASPYYERHGPMISITRQHVIWLIRITGIAAVVWYAYLSGLGAWPFDAEHPKRVFISFAEDVSHSSSPVNKSNEISA
jgi:hypothetical protein